MHKLYVVNGIFLFTYKTEAKNGEITWLGIFSYWVMESLFPP